MEPMKKSRITRLVRWMLVVLFIVVAVVGSGYYLYQWQQDKVDNLDSKVTSLTSQLDSQKIINQQLANTYLYTSKGGVKLKVFVPEKNSKVSSPLVVIGQVPGNWSFEASFPIAVKDSIGTVLVREPAQLLGDWMTDQLVPFWVKLEFPAATGDGTLLLQKDNPSGLPEKDDSLSIPIKF